MRAFISYSHDSPAHIAWVSGFAARIAAAGAEVRLDQDHLHYGDDVNRFMEDEVAKADVVLMVCTPTYVSKSNARRGGVGYESVILSTQLVQDQDSRKFVPILRESATAVPKLPSFMGNRLFVDMSIGDGFGRDFDRLIAQLGRSNAESSVLHRSGAKQLGRRIEIEGPHQVLRLDEQLQRVLELFNSSEPNLVSVEPGDLRALFGDKPFWYVNALALELSPNYESLANHVALQATSIRDAVGQRFRSIGVSIAGPRARLKVGDSKSVMHALRSLVADDAHVVYTTSVCDLGARIVLAFA